jgi:single-strand DNA-binding protein
MANEAQISLTGYVATQPSFWTTTSGATKVTMRVAWTPRYIDRSTGDWTDGTTSYVTVICWRKLADNVALCVRKGDPVVVKGRLSVRPYEKDGMRRIVVEVDASSVGHDMSRGAAHFQRTKRAPGETAVGQLAGGLPGDAGLRRDGAAAGDEEPVMPGAGSGYPDADHAAGPGGPDGEDIFDESAIAALAPEPVPEPEPVSAPF